MVTLNRNATDLFLSQRSFTNESKTGGDSDGDWFRSVYSYCVQNGSLTVNQYNALVDQYNSNEDEADKLPSNLEGTPPGGGTPFGIASLPSRPRPIHK